MVSATWHACGATAVASSIPRFSGRDSQSPNSFDGSTHQSYGDKASTISMINTDRRARESHEKGDPMILSNAKMISPADLPVGASAPT